MPIKYRIEIIPSAWKDLKKIEDYYIIQFDVETAIKVSDHIFSLKTKVNVAATLVSYACVIVNM